MTEEERRALEIQTLKNRSPFALPNNPSQSGWTTQQIKEKFYAGLLYLYDLFYSIRGSLEQTQTNVETAIEQNTATIQQALNGQNTAIQSIQQELNTAMKNKGSVATFADLPANPEFGDTYNVLETDNNYMWNGTFWDALAGDYYTKLETVALIAEKENPITAGNGLVREGDTISSLITAADIVINIQ